MSNLAEADSALFSNLKNNKLSSKVSAGNRSRFAFLTTIGLALLLLATMLFSLGVGATGTSVFNIFLYYTNMSNVELSAYDKIILFDLRLPRTILGALVGASLAVSGAILQGLFRNPLADPGLIGVSAGASLAAVSVIVLGTTVLAPVTALLGIYALPIAAFWGGLLTTIVLYLIATRRGQTSVATMLLAGIALAALTSALSGVLIYMSDDLQMRDLIFWQLGALTAATWEKIWAVSPFILLSFIAVPFIANGLNALVLGEAEAKYMGVPVQLLKRVVVILVACSVGASVAAAGTIGFIGIVVPHLLRLLIGPDHRYLLVASGLLGAALLIAADCISRTVVAPAELPIGIVTAAIGGPFFLWILLRHRNMLDL